jgi:hypothetical protein
MENLLTWMFCSRAARKWPSSWTVTIAASTPTACAVDPGPLRSTPGPVELPCAIPSWCSSSQAANNSSVGQQERVKRFQARAAPLVCAAGFEV